MEVSFMKAVNLASYDFRGYEYYKEGKVISHEQISEGVYQGQVSSDNAVYNVMIDLNKVRNSSCDCPFDKSGTRFICKHIVALFFAIFPDDAFEYKAKSIKSKPNTRSGRKSRRRSWKHTYAN